MTVRSDPIVLDFSVLFAYERVRTAAGGAMRATQSRVAGWFLQDILLLLLAQSVALASSWCGGKLPELEFLLHGDPDQDGPKSMASGIVSLSSLKRWVMSLGSACLWTTLTVVYRLG